MKCKQKISFISTVFNETSTISPLINSILQQTQKIDEVIIVDGESTDGTVKKISNFKFQISNKTVKVFTKKGNRSVGRNFGIKHASGDIILVSDAGCILDKNWAKEITKPFNDPSVAVVSGYYHPVTKTVFQQCLATYTSVMPDKIDPTNFLPSSRSVAFRKNAWEKVHYPEEYDTCEDLIFDVRLKKQGFIFAFAKKAIVYWPQRETVYQAFKQFYIYARGDGQAHYIRKQTPLLFIRYIAGIILLLISARSKSIHALWFFFVLFIIYLFWAVAKNYRYVNHWQAIIYLPLLQLTADIAVLFGTITGYVQSIFRTKFL